ncbi:hypothetical protein HDV00_001824 [Rhizophlyctis rosea]|nr:hypothetical protein HDV00_001824 [Rhizophlyctis rosea]
MVAYTAAGPTTTTHTPSWHLSVPVAGAKLSPSPPPTSPSPFAFSPNPLAQLLSPSSPTPMPSAVPSSPTPWSVTPITSSSTIQSTTTTTTSATPAHLNVMLSPSPQLTSTSTTSTITKKSTTSPSPTPAKPAITAVLSDNDYDDMSAASKIVLYAFVAIIVVAALAAIGICWRNVESAVYRRRRGRRSWSWSSEESDLDLEDAGRRRWWWRLGRHRRGVETSGTKDDDGVRILGPFDGEDGSLYGTMRSFGSGGTGSPQSLRRGVEGGGLYGLSQESATSLVNGGGLPDLLYLPQPTSPTILLHPQSPPAIHTCCDHQYKYEYIQPSYPSPPHIRTTTPEPNPYLPIPESLYSSHHHHQTYNTVPRHIHTAQPYHYPTVPRARTIAHTTTNPIQTPRLFNTTTAVHKQHHVPAPLPPRIRGLTRDDIKRDWEERAKVGVEVQSSDDMVAKSMWYQNMRRNHRRRQSESPVPPPPPPPSSPEVPDFHPADPIQEPEMGHTFTDMGQNFAPSPLPAPSVPPFLAPSAEDESTHDRMGSEGNETDVSDDATIVPRPRRKVSLEAFGL